MSVSCNCGAKRTPFVGAVPSFEQFSAQQRRAVAVSASLLGMSAALQQSMSPISWSMPQDCSPNSTGTPAKALPLSISTSIRAVTRIRMTVIHSMKRAILCQDDLSTTGSNGNLGQRGIPASSSFESRIGDSSAIVLSTHSARHFSQISAAQAQSVADHRY